MSVAHGAIALATSGCTQPPVTRGLSAIILCMAFTNEHYAVCIATLGAVEASGDYGAITALDTLSLGIGQWTQERAYDLLNKFPAGTSFGSTVDGWMAQGRSSWTYDSRKYQYLSAADRTALRGQLTSSTGKSIQDKTMYNDIHDSYLAACRRHGLDPEAYPDPAILLIVVMHRWGENAKILSRIVAGAGSSPTIDTMCAAIKYQGEWAAVPNRYATAEKYVRGHITNGVVVDGSGNDNTGDPVADPTDGNSSLSAGEDEYASTVSRVVAVGDGTLFVEMTDGSRATAFPSTVNVWRCSAESQVVDRGQSQAIDSSPTGETTGSGTSDERMDAMIARALSDAQRKPYRYLQSTPGRLHPDTSGFSDCSGYVWFLYNKYFGVDINSGGSAAMISDNKGKVIAQGSGTFNAGGKVRKGDVIICQWTFGGGHVEVFTGVGDQATSMRSMTANGPADPQSAAITFGASCRLWKVKRYV